MARNHEFYRPDLEEEDMLATSRQIERDLLKVIDTDSVILDVGANRGQFALEILKILPETKIYSFEPIVDAYEELKSVSQLNPQIIPVNRAVSLKTGQSMFFVTASDVGSSLLDHCLINLHNGSL